MYRPYLLNLVKMLNSFNNPYIASFWCAILALYMIKWLIKYKSVNDWLKVLFRIYEWKVYIWYFYIKL